MPTTVIPRFLSPYNDECWKDLYKYSFHIEMLGLDVVIVRLDAFRSIILRAAAGTPYGRFQKNNKRRNRGADEFREEKENSYTSSNSMTES